MVLDFLILKAMDSVSPPDQAAGKELSLKLCLGTPQKFFQKL
jgi:hypothetical protein